MRRIRVSPRPGWQALVETQGLTWHSDKESVSWDESVAYVLTRSEVESLLETAYEVSQLFQKACSHVVENNLWAVVGLDDDAAKIVAASWKRGEFSLCGRFDFLFDDQAKPKLLEFNAETALSLVETAVIQKHWLADVMPQLGQCNDLESRLVHAWRQSGFEHVHCTWRPRHGEVEGTARYMARVLKTAGLRSSMMAMHRIGWDSRRRAFVDEQGAPIQACYKIYPWDWMLNEPFAAYVNRGLCRFIEPAWRLMAGSKGILCVLSDLFGDHPAVLACSRSPEENASAYVRKPLFGHEGQNVSICRDDAILESLPGECGNQKMVFQAMVASPRFDGHLPQFGVWVVGHEPVAIGMRESDTLIITGKSPFVPHVID